MVHVGSPDGGIIFLRVVNTGILPRDGVAFSGGDKNFGGVRVKSWRSVALEEEGEGGLDMRDGTGPLTVRVRKWMRVKQEGRLLGRGLALLPLGGRLDSATDHLHALKVSADSFLSIDSRSVQIHV